MTTTEFSNIVSTLITNGFHIKQVDRISPENSIISTSKYDKLGAEIKYTILFSADKTETAILNTLERKANSSHSKPLLISDSITNSDIKTYTHEQFYNLLGGIVNTGLILIPNLSEILNDLGHNILPHGLVGRADDLLELYTKECFQFILESPTRRYGRDRLFSKLPDGVILCKEKYMILYDSKAYNNGFEFQSDDINRFAFYVNDFNNRYASFFGSIFAFIVISGHFKDSEKSISKRSSELYKLCSCKLCCIRGDELGKIVQLIRNNPEKKGSISWKNILSNLIIEIKFVRQELKRISKDNLH